MNEHQPLLAVVVKSGSNNGNDVNEEQQAPSKQKYMPLVLSFIVYSIIAGFTTAILPLSKGWRLFSWHPLLMIGGTVGMTGVAIHTKKLGGYENTKRHGIIMMLGLFMTYGGLFAIYKNKDLSGKKHFMTLHSVLGLLTIVGYTLSMLAGLTFLHPDIGIDKKDTKKRSVHKWFSRIVILISWITSFIGLNHSTRYMTNNYLILALFAAPLIVLTPFTLILKS